MAGDYRMLEVEAALSVLSCSRLLRLMFPCYVDRTLLGRETGHIRFLCLLVVHRLPVADGTGVAIGSSCNTRAFTSAGSRRATLFLPKTFPILVTG